MKIFQPTHQISFSLLFAIWKTKFP